MPRPKKPRFVMEAPGFRYFKPAGVPMRTLSEEKLTVEELEALRLADLEGLYQDEAAERMEVSRQTFQRILKSARRKVASSLIEGKAIGVEGGDYVIAGEERILECGRCGHTWGQPFGSGKRAWEYSCPRCRGRSVRRACPRGGRGRFRKGIAGPAGRENDGGDFKEDPTGRGAGLIP